ncbi:MAG: exodeoxyribonuclease III [Lachnospiraceae bacterium]|nr:exodeoxyribonuclease III [Lachnospiraceae bacterium]
MEKKLISWNVNGLRACMGKGFMDFFKREAPDVLCLQETKLQEGQISLELPGYRQYWNYADKKGYSGTAVFTREEPLSVHYGLDIDEHDHEGRVITLEYPDYYLTCVYVPNAKEDLSRLSYRQVWENDFLAFHQALAQKKPVIWCGDLNVAHREIDLKNPRSNRGRAGFTDEEREKFQAVIDAGFIDTFRHFYPDKEGAYSWWSYRFHARENNAGWRIDYFIASAELAHRLKDARIYADVYGSDHCPVGLTLA